MYILILFCLRTVLSKYKHAADAFLSYALSDWSEIRLGENPKRKKIKYNYRKYNNNNIFTYMYMFISEKPLNIAIQSSSLEKCFSELKKMNIFKATTKVSDLLFVNSRIAIILQLFFYHSFKEIVVSLKVCNIYCICEMQKNLRLPLW